MDARWGSGKLGVSPCRKTAGEASVRNRGFLRSGAKRVKRALERKREGAERLIHINVENYSLCHKFKFIKP